jgi:hypothetical protein
MVAKSVDRKVPFSLTIIVSGSSYVYDLASTSHVTITVPTTARVRDLLTDFVANASTPIQNLISLDATGTGSGLVTALSTKTSSALVYQKIQNISQLKYYYDATDLEYIIIRNVLASSPSPNVIYILDTSGKSGSTLTDFIDIYNTGDWFAACTTALTEALQITLTDYFDNVERVAFFTVQDTDAVDRLGKCQSSHVLFLAHDAPDDHPEASLLAKNLPFLPTVIYKGVKDLQGQTANTTTSLSDLINIRTAKGNCYVKDETGNVTDGGQTTDPAATTAAPTFMDQTISRLWIKIETRLALKAFFVAATARGERIPYTNPGINALLAAGFEPIRTAGKKGVIATIDTPEQAAKSFDGVYRAGIRAATREEIEAERPADITARNLTGITYWYIESGAIEGAVITETILLTEGA